MRAALSTRPGASRPPYDLLAGNMEGLKSDIANPLAEFCCNSCSESVVAIAGNENGYGITASLSVAPVLLLLLPLLLLLLLLVVVVLLLLILLLLELLEGVLLQLVPTGGVLLTFLNALFELPPSGRPTSVASVTSVTSITSHWSVSSLLLAFFSTVPVRKATSKLRFGADWLFSTVISIVILNQTTTKYFTLQSSQESFKHPSSIHQTSTKHPPNPPSRPSQPNEPTMKEKKHRN